MEDHKGQKSMMRLMSGLFAVTSVIVALLLSWSIYNGTGDNHTIGIYLTVLFLLAATAPKALQKYIELLFSDRIPEIGKNGS